MVTHPMSPSTYMTMSSAGVTDADKFTQHVKDKFGYVNEELIQNALSQEVRDVFLSYGVYDAYEIATVLAATGFPNIDWKDFAEFAFITLNIHTMVTDFLNDTSDYSYVLSDPEFRNHCSFYCGTDDDAYAYFYAFVLYKYGDGCSYKDFVVKSHKNTIPLSVNGVVLKLIERFNVTDPVWVIDTLLSTKDTSSLTFDECITFLKDLIRNGVK